MRNYPVSRKINLVIQEMDGEVLIYDLSEDKAFCLNETSALVWQACDGEKSVTEITKFVGQKLNSSATEDLVWFAIELLKKESLIENASELDNHFEGMSRRQAVKKIGLSSLLAIPVIMAIQSPVAARAASACAPTNPPGCPTTGSGRPPGCVCSGGGNCTSGMCIPAQNGHIACCG